jgi:hypothetical protein
MSGLLGSHVTEPGKMPADDFVPRHVECQQAFLMIYVCFSFLFHDET